MKSRNVRLIIRSRAEKSISIEQRHKNFISAVSKINPPLGFSDIDLPSVPDCGAELLAEFGVKLSTRGVKFSGYYVYRGVNYHYEDSAKFDDSIRYEFSVKKTKLNYEHILKADFPSLIEAYQGYSARLAFDDYDSAYKAGVEPSESGETFFDENGSAIRDNAIYNSLVSDKAIDIDGRNNIYVLRPAQYWDNELCNRALGYGPDEVVKRLQGTKAEVRRLMDGVYIVLDYDINITYENFLEMNSKYKTLLGLI